ncbi:hypothetical protein [Mesorhizobium sp. WSM2239]|uniref:Outer membrane protein beta-barrel domain-containing protein n=2 Tax=unclassified Mesorhizobium TaxID=325217 RepID=A0AAU8D753_9HYPH
MTRSLITLLTALAWTSAASAADVALDLPQEAPPPQAKEWTFSIAPYLWAAGLNGDVGLFGRQPVDVDMSFSDVFSNLRFGGMVVSELHNGTWGLFGDLIYVSTEADQSITRTVLGAPATLSARVETQSLTATVMGEYRAFAREYATVDLMAGARIWSVDNEISAALAAGGPEIAAFSGSDGATWVDPMIGAKARINTNSPWYFTAWGMIGGFGASADLEWDVLGGVGYQWNDRIATVGGYRALGVDYQDDGFVYDIVQHGWFFGAVMRF